MQKFISRTDPDHHTYPASHDKWWETSSIASFCFTLRFYLCLLSGPDPNLLIYLHPCSYVDPDLDPNPAPHEEEVASNEDCNDLLAISVLQCWPMFNTLIECYNVKFWPVLQCYSVKCWPSQCYSSACGLPLRSTNKRALF